MRQTLESTLEFIDCAKFILASLKGFVDEKVYLLLEKEIGKLEKDWINSKNSKSTNFDDRIIKIHFFITGSGV